jgi:hypothetical protein
MKERQANTAQVYGRKTSGVRKNNRKDRHTRHLKAGQCPAFFFATRIDTMVSEPKRQSSLDPALEHLATLQSDA